MAKLTEQDVLWIREMSAYKALPNIKMSKILGISSTEVDNIVNGKRWRV